MYTGSYTTRVYIEAPVRPEVVGRGVSLVLRVTSQGQSGPGNFVEGGTVLVFRLNGKLNNLDDLLL